MNRSARKGRARVASASGQALVPALMFLLVGCIGLYVAFNSFQMSSAKIKLQNTADAAAYSAAVLQARDYNFSAYTNRAMVANQVTAAQVVALKSWIDELDTTYSPPDPDPKTSLELDRTVNDFADNPALWTAPKQIGKADIAPVRAALDALLPTVARNIGTLNRELSVAQANYHAQMITVVPDTADAVAQINQPDTHVTSGYFTGPRNAAQLAAWASYTATIIPSAPPPPDVVVARDNFADVVTSPGPDASTCPQTTGPDSLDCFVKNRASIRSVAPNFQQLNSTADKICGPNSTFTITVTHDGGTQLRNDKAGWQSIDASTAHLKVSCLGPIEAIAGYGGSSNGNITSFMSRPPFAAWQDWQGYGGCYNFGYRASRPPGLGQDVPLNPGQGVPDAMAKAFSVGPGNSLDPLNGGLLPYQEVDGVQFGNRAPRITIEVTRNVDSLVKTERLKGGGRLQIDNNGAGGVMRALSSASAYFVRPDETGSNSSMLGRLMNADQWARADHKTEYPNLFSPYWQASLAPVSTDERTAAWAGQIPAASEVAAQ
ncbi:pilus assembly protein TadG-related protein [Paraburkholderia metrosideri]|uniref:Putative Flp pilus-assembly TadG-like N-terminal domain-containing protein n=1 Tax=Paraburkholderia metrosideri TaxID=580937 RepID=A0ABM8P0S0_9BURK|nr:pilus assembly protein TadG-related protein [Paraburkholderia metrosideri]CAD6552669.1 hypothetical protein LMG28140_05179 [Paraburkholderia metrosideri]